MKESLTIRKVGGASLWPVSWLTIAAIVAIWVRGCDREELVSLEFNGAKGNIGFHRAAEVRCVRGGLWVGYGYEDPYPFPDGVYIKRGLILRHQYRDFASYPASPFVKWARYWRGFAVGPPADQPGGRDSDGRQQYRFVVFPLWILALPALACAGVWVRGSARRRKQRRRRARGQCVFCGYDLRASSSQCPECGKTPSTSPNAVRGVGTRVLNWGAVAFAGALFVYLAALPIFALTCRTILGLSVSDQLKLSVARAWADYADGAKLGDGCFRILPDSIIRRDGEGHFVRLPTAGLWYLVSDGKHTYLTSHERISPEMDPDEVSWHI
ncbi:MAG: hypothetical protein JWN24_3248 [Phycisphaerales bacterium]|nr:hypothetical protein [Phycisphaerales bacterium]